MAAGCKSQNIYSYPVCHKTRITLEICYNIKIPAVLAEKENLMKIDLHIHTSTGSTGLWPVEEY